MFARCRLLAAGVGLVLSVVLGGCIDLTQFTNALNPEFLSAMGLGTDVTSLPGDAPGLLVEVENRTDRWARAVVAYRDGDDNVASFTTLVAPSDKTGQMLVCPVAEITLGDLSSPGQSGVLIYLIDDVGGSLDSLDSAPFIEVDPFGVLLQEGVNYDCGDGLVFTVEPSSAARSGYQTFAYVRRSGTP